MGTQRCRGCGYLHTNIETCWCSHKQSSFLGVNQLGISPACTHMLLYKIETDGGNTKIEINYHVITKEKGISDWEVSGRHPGGGDA